VTDTVPVPAAVPLSVGFEDGVISVEALKAPLLCAATGIAGNARSAMATIRREKERREKERMFFMPLSYGSTLTLSIKMNVG
jgi:hypothetical protein